MSIRKKPQAKERKLDAYLNAASAPQKEKIVRDQLRLPEQLVQQIDDLRASALIKKSRHAWYLEAIAEKLQREQTF